MIKVSAMYPYGEGRRFDVDYYCNSHVPLAKRLMGAACRGIEVDIGLGGREPGSPPPYVAIAHMLFDSLDAFRAAFAPHAATFAADAPNYTDIKPQLQISEIRP